MKNIKEQYIEHGKYHGIIKIADIVFNDEYNNEILELIEKFPKNYMKMLKSKAFHKNKSKDRTYLLNYILNSTPLLDDDFYTLKTRVYWTINKMTTFPWCQNNDEMDHQMIRYNVDNIKDGYGKFCNTKCQHESTAYFQSIKSSLQMKYGEGVTNAFQIQSVKDDIKTRKNEIEDKKKNTRKLHFGDEPGWNLKQSLTTRKKLYGNAINLVKSKQTKLSRYGDQNWNNPIKNFKTRKANNTMSSSSQEDLIYDILCNHLDKDQIERQYISDKYPFHSDFYLKMFDLYIECNFSWTHGGHRYDQNSIEDQQMLEKWRSKYTEYYDNAIQTWTVRDQQKFEIAENNHLNYLVFWNVDEATKILDNDQFYDNIGNECIKSRMNEVVDNG